MTDCRGRTASPTQGLRAPPQGADPTSPPGFGAQSRGGAGAEPAHSPPPTHRKRKKGPGRKGGAGPEPRPLPCALLDLRARPSTGGAERAVRTLAGTCAAATMSQEGVEVGDDYDWAGGPREMPGRGRGREAGFAVPRYSIRSSDLSLAGACPPLRKESDCHLPLSEMRPPRRKAGAAVSRVRGQGLSGWPPPKPGTLAPVHTLPQSPVGTLAFSRKCLGGMEVGGAEAKTEGQVRAQRRKTRDGGGAIALLLTPSEPT